MPPKEFTDKGKLWVRYVSPTPATKVDVILLKELLDKKLEHGTARDVGICPIRETLFQQCFDELIRQITINCAERGFLLVRVRDEFRQQLQAYQSLYDSSIAYGMRQALVAESKRRQMNERQLILEDQIDKLENQISELQSLQNDIIKKDEEAREELKKEHDAFKEEMRIRMF